MTFRPIQSTVMATYKGKFVDIYLPIAGHNAVMYWWNTDLGGFWEPYETSPMAFESAKKAYAYAKAWAKDEDLPYVEHKELE